jgi:hypothetical protein
LRNTIHVRFQKKLTEREISWLLTRLEAQGIISVSGKKVTYSLQPTTA